MQLVAEELVVFVRQQVGENLPPAQLSSAPERRRPDARAGSTSTNEVQNTPESKAVFDVATDSSEDSDADSFVTADEVRTFSNKLFLITLKLHSLSNNLINQ